MTLTKIEAEIEIPEGFEFDRIDTKTRDGDYDFEEYPLYCHNIEYIVPRIILRKKTRPAYRVYRFIESGNTYTRDGKDGVRDNYLKDEGTIREWISEWIEYDQPNKWPTPLVERIAAIDLEAAQWIVEHWDHLLEEKYTLGSYDRMNDRLGDMFYWSHSPQEHNYWSKISDKLGE